MMNRTRRYGNRTNGKRPRPSSCGKTLRVAVVTVSVKFPITPALKCMENPNTLTYPIQNPTATAVIQVNIPESSNALYAEKLFQNPKVKDALHVLRTEIGNALDHDKEQEREMWGIRADFATAALMDLRKSLERTETGSR